jgi:hypothetical protein
MAAGTGPAAMGRPAGRRGMVRLQGWLSGKGCVILPGDTRDGLQATAGRRGIVR